MTRRINILLSTLLAVAGTTTLAQQTPLKTDGEYLSPAHFLNPEGNAGTQVLLVGSWHFSYPSLDAHVTEQAHRVDVLTDERQEEMAEVLDYLAHFEPETIALECNRGSGYAERYQQFLAGELREQRNERYQIGFRLAKRLQLDEVHCVDANSFAANHMEKLRAMEAIPEDYDFKSNDELSQRYEAWAEFKDRLMMDATLLEGLAYTNREDVLDTGFGVYLVGDFKLGEYGGADALALHWYNRNLRIFRNIQRLAENGHERILVLFGSGHMQILKDLVDSSPEFKRVHFGNL